MDGFRVYTGALTNGEITVMQSGNLPPTLNPVPNQTTDASIVLSITNTASDPDLPWQTLTFSLLTPPPGAIINSGVITWRPTVAQANTTNQFQVKVADNGTPSLSATQSFLVTIKPLAASEPERRGDLERTIHGADQWRLRARLCDREFDQSVGLVDDLHDQLTGSAVRLGGFRFEPMAGEFLSRATPTVTVRRGMPTEWNAAGHAGFPVFRLERPHEFPQLECIWRLGLWIWVMG